MAATLCSTGTPAIFLHAADAVHGEQFAAETASDEESAGKSGPHGEKTGKVVAIDKWAKGTALPESLADEALTDTDKGDQNTDDDDDIDGNDAPLIGIE